MTSGEKKRLEKQQKDKESKQKKQLEQEIKENLNKAKAELFSKFQIITRREILQYFVDTYGSNFDVNSLMNSLQYNVGRDPLSFDISYNDKDFSFLSNILVNIQEFNQNAKKDTIINNFLAPDEQKSLIDENSIFYGENNLYSEIYARTNSRKFERGSVFSPHNKILNSGGYSDISQTYKKAKEKALQIYQDEYNHKLKKDIEKKYGLIK